MRHLVHEVQFRLRAEGKKLVTLASVVVLSLLPFFLFFASFCLVVAVATTRLYGHLAPHQHIPLVISV